MLREAGLARALHHGTMTADVTTPGLTRPEVPACLRMKPRFWP